MYVLVYFSTDNIAVTLHRLQITEIGRIHVVKIGVHLRKLSQN